MGTMVSQIKSLTIVYSTVYSNADRRKHQSSASLAFVRGIHWWLVNSPHKWPVTWKKFPFDDVFMLWHMNMNATQTYTGSGNGLVPSGNIYLWKITLNFKFKPILIGTNELTHLPPVFHICITELGQHWFRWWLVAYSAPSHYLFTSAGLLLIGHLGTNFSEIVIKIQNFSFMKMLLKILSAKCLSRGRWVNLLHQKCTRFYQHVTTVITRQFMESSWATKDP